MCEGRACHPKFIIECSVRLTKALTLFGYSLCAVARVTQCSTAALVRPCSTCCGFRAEPPRPSPSAVLYSTNEVPPGYEDNSSVTEKGDLSSDDDDDTKVRLSDQTLHS